MNYLFFILTIWGLTHILVSSKIFSSLRNFFLVKIPFIGNLLDCYQCTGFWSGFLLYFIYQPPRISIFDVFNLDPLFWGFIGSGICSYLSVLLSYFITKSKSRDI